MPVQVAIYDSSIDRHTFTQHKSLQLRARYVTTGNYLGLLFFSLLRCLIIILFFFNHFCDIIISFFEDKDILKIIRLSRAISQNKNVINKIKIFSLYSKICGNNS